MVKSTWLPFIPITLETNFLQESLIRKMACRLQLLLHDDYCHAEQTHRAVPRVFDPSHPPLRAIHDREWMPLTAKASAVGSRPHQTWHATATSRPAVNCPVAQPSIQSLGQRVRRVILHDTAVTSDRKHSNRRLRCPRQLLSVQENPSGTRHGSMPKE
jgi:hypothetical protein